MKYLVTGGAGFIGSHFCELILNNENTQKLYVLDKFTYAGLEENLENIKNDKRLEIIKGDICEASKFLSAIEDCNILLNFAAITTFCI